MPNGVTAAAHEQRWPRRHTRLLKLRPAGGGGGGDDGDGGGGGGVGRVGIAEEGYRGETASSETAGTYWRQPARH